MFFRYVMVYLIFGGNDSSRGRTGRKLCNFISDFSPGWDIFLFLLEVKQRTHWIIDNSVKYYEVYGLYRNFIDYVD